MEVYEHAFGDVPDWLIPSTFLNLVLVLESTVYKNHVQIRNDAVIYNIHKNLGTGYNLVNTNDRWRNI